MIKTMDNTILWDRVKKAENLQLGLLASGPDGSGASREMMCSIIEAILAPSVRQLMLLGGHNSNAFIDTPVIMVYDLESDKWSFSDARIPLHGGYSHWNKIFKVNDRLLLAAYNFSSMLINVHACSPNSGNDRKIKHEFFITPSRFGIHDFSSPVMLDNGQVMMINASLSDERRMHCILDLNRRKWIKKSTSNLPGLDSCCVLMNDGRVLVVGGLNRWHGEFIADCFIYYPVSNRFVRTTSLGGARCGAAGCLLDDGRVFICGGQLFDESCEIFNPATCTWSAGGSMLYPRRHHVCFHIANDRIFIVGGIDYENKRGPRSCEMYDIITQTSTRLADIPEERSFMTVAPLY